MKYSGKAGFKSESVETRPGTYQNQVIERSRLWPHQLCKGSGYCSLLCYQGHRRCAPHHGRPEDQHQHRGAEG
jgi:hypothetical protein